MLVKALRNDDGFYRVQVGKIYVVYACVFEINSGDNSLLNYYIETKDDFRTRSVFMGHDAAKFELVHGLVPDDWISSTLDLRQELLNYIERLRALKGYEEEMARLQKIADAQGERPRRLLITAFPEMNDYDFAIAVHDDNMDDEHHEVFAKYKKKYEKLHENILNK